jgi:hypothetical protein
MTLAKQISFNYLKNKLVKDFILNPHSPKYRSDTRIHQVIVHSLFPQLVAFADHGNDAYKLYLELNPGRRYPSTPSSDKRSFNTLQRVSTAPHSTEWKPLNVNPVDEDAEAAAVTLLKKYRCSTPCPCDIPSVYDVPPLPFSKVDSSFKHVRPNTQIANKLLLLHQNIRDANNTKYFGPPKIPSSATQKEVEELKLCLEWREKYQVVIGSSWGKLPVSLQESWKSEHTCDAKINSLS